MDPVLRGFIIYFAVWLFIRLSGRRTLAELTTFDFVLLLIIAEATQQALLGDDFSVTNGLLLVLTLITINIALAVLQRYWPPIGKVFNGVSMVIVEEGRPLRELMERARVEDEDVLEAARRFRGSSVWTRLSTRCSRRAGAYLSFPRTDLGADASGDRLRDAAPAGG
jgi:uncharacterized membrane protein YcaP (DUF421 family)